MTDTVLHNPTLYERPLACVDLETTGTNPRRNRIIEIGVVLLDPDGSRSEWQTLVDPGVSIPPFIESFTGIGNAEVEGAPAFGDIADELLELLGDRVLVAHNARFDYGFLRNEFQRIGVKFHRQPLCTVKLSRTLYPAGGRHNLDAVIRRCGLPHVERHRAMGDTLAVESFIRHAYEKFGKQAVDSAIAAQLKRPTLPQQLSGEQVDALPEGPGVYRFYDANGVLLYVGKSVNVRSRVLSHFSADHSSAKEMRLAQQVRHVDFTSTAGELGALLLESREIKERLPVLNRRQRRNDKLLTLAVKQDPAAALTIETLDLRPSAFEADSKLFGVFRSKRAVTNALREIAAENRLCPRKLGLEPRGSGACFARQLKKCAGVCEGAESDIAHHLRLIEALADLKLKTWPFDGRIGVREDDGNGRAEIHLLDNWCYLGSVDADEYAQGDLLRNAGGDAVFDLDTYRILTRFLLGKSRRPDIVRA